MKYFLNCVIVFQIQVNLNQIIEISIYQWHWKILIGTRWLHLNFICRFLNSSGALDKLKEHFFVRKCSLDNDIGNDDVQYHRTFDTVTYEYWLITCTNWSQQLLLLLLLLYFCVSFLKDQSVRRQKPYLFRCFLNSESWSTAKPPSYIMQSEKISRSGLLDDWILWDQMFCYCKTSNNEIHVFIKKLSCKEIFEQNEIFTVNLYFHCEMIYEYICDWREFQKCL